MTNPSAAFHLTQVNVGRALGEMTEPVMAEFAAALPAINALAEGTPGFLWRLQTEDGDATAIRPYEDNRILINLSVWTDLSALRGYVFQSDHGGLPAAPTGMVRAVRESLRGTLVGAGRPPASIAEAVDRLAHLEAHGPTGYAFGFATPFGPDGLPVAREAEADDACPAT